MCFRGGCAICLTAAFPCNNCCHANHCMFLGPLWEVVGMLSTMHICQNSWLLVWPQACNCSTCFFVTSTLSVANSVPAFGDASEILISNTSLAYPRRLPPALASGSTDACMASCPASTCSYC